MQQTAIGWRNVRPVATAMALLLWNGLAVAATHVIPGAGPPEISLRALATEFTRQRLGTVIGIPQSVGIAGGLRALQSGEASVARLARRLTEDERLCCTTDPAGRWSSGEVG
jgi:hypothetical protein